MGDAVQAAHALLNRLEAQGASFDLSASASPPPLPELARGVAPPEALPAGEGDEVEGDACLC